MQHATPVLAEHRQPPHPVPEPPEHSGAAAGLTDLSRSLATYGPVLRSAGGSAADELPVSSPDDPEEREADQIADRIMRSASDSCDCGGTCGHCGDKPAAVAASDTDGVLHRDGVPGTPASGPVPPTPVSPATDVPKPPDQPSQFPPQDQPKTGEERVKDLQDKLGKGGTKALGQGLSLAADEFSKSWLGKQITDGMEREPVVRFFTKTPVGVVSIVALGVGGLAAGLLTEWTARDPGAPGAAPKDEKITSLQFTWGLGGPTEFQLKTPWIDTPKVPAAKPAAAAPLGEPPELMKVTVRGSGICTPTSDGEVGGPDDAAFIYLWLTRNRNGPEKPLPQLRTPPMGPGIGGTMFKRKPGHTGASDPAAVRRGLSSAGAVLDPADRAFMESRLGTSFGHVRVHSGSEAAAAAASVHANAFTVGHDVVFGGGKYEPGSAAGRRLLAHELTHVVQRSAVLQRAPRSVGTRYEYAPGAKSTFKDVRATFDGADFTVFDGTAPLMTHPAQSGRPVSVRPADAAACKGDVAESYLNNPRYVGISDFGPIPEGDFSVSLSTFATFSTLEQLEMITGGMFIDPFGSALHGGDWGSGRAPLRPKRIVPGARGCGNTTTRSGFYLHGGSLPGSSGCIDIDNDGIDALLKLLSGYRRDIPVRVVYTRPPPAVGRATRGVGRLTYPTDDQGRPIKEPSIWDRLKSLAGE